MLKKFLFVVPVALLAAVVLPQTIFGWSSACGCVPSDQLFAQFIDSKRAAAGDDDPMTDFTDAEVTAAFWQAMPRGSTLAHVEQTSKFTESECKLEGSTGYHCEYWLQSNYRSERGYRLRYTFAPGKGLADIDVTRIERRNLDGSLF